MRRETWMWVGLAVLVWILWRRLYGAAEWVGGAVGTGVGWLEGLFGGVAGWVYGSGDYDVQDVLQSWYLGWLVLQDKIEPGVQILPPEYGDAFRDWREQLYSATFLKAGMSLDRGQAQEVWQWLNDEHGVQVPNPFAED